MPKPGTRKRDGQDSGPAAKRGGSDVQPHANHSTDPKKNTPVEQATNKAVVPQKPEALNTGVSRPAAKPGGSDVPPPANHSTDPMNTPVKQATKKAVVSQKPEALSTSVNTTADQETSKAGSTGQFDDFESQMKLIQKGKITPTSGTSPSQFASPGRAKRTSKVWVAGLKSGQMVAYVTDKNNPDAPAYIKEGIARLRDDAKLREAASVSEIMMKKADKLPFDSWSLRKVSQTSGSEYTLHWYVFVRTFDNLADHTPQVRSKWGETLAKFFTMTDQPNKFEYGGDLSKEKTCPASDFFTIQDVMTKFIMKRLEGVYTEGEAVKNIHILESYYGDDTKLTAQVVKFYVPNEQADNEVDQGEQNENKELFDLFSK
jgi:hypothetical protein